MLKLGNDPDYELLPGGGHSNGNGNGNGRLSLGSDEEEWRWLQRAPHPLAAGIRKLGFNSKKSLWGKVLPIIALFLSATVFILTSLSVLRYLKLSGIYQPAYRNIPVISDAQIEAAASRHLTSDQCLELYPGLYEEADRAVQYWEQRGGVSINQIDEASTRGQTARILIYDNEMYIRRFEWERGSRSRATLALIQEALLTAVEPVPNVEFVVMTDDKGDIGDQLPIFVLDRKAPQNWLWLMPDYGFNSWPEPKVGAYSEVLRKAKEWDEKMPWQDKIPQLFWKGAFLVDIRKKLADLAKEYSWGAIEEVDWRNKDTVMTMDEHCKYKFLGHVEGFAYSGRLKYILGCRSVVVAHEMEYIQHFHHLINSTMGSPHQNMVVVPGTDWKKLPDTMDILLEDDNFAKELADKSFKFWQHYISKKSIDCYWRYLLHRWAEVQRYTPELHYTDTPYVSFALMGKTDWDPY